MLCARASILATATDSRGTIANTRLSMSRSDVPRSSAYAAFSAAAGSRRPLEYRTPSSVARKTSGASARSATKLPSFPNSYPVCAVIPGTADHIRATYSSDETARFWWSVAKPPTSARAARSSERVYRSIIRHRMRAVSSVFFDRTTNIFCRMDTSRMHDSSVAHGIRPIFFCGAWNAAPSTSSHTSHPHAGSSRISVRPVRLCSRPSLRLAARSERLLRSMTAYTASPRVIA